MLLDRVCKTCGTTFLGGPRAYFCPDCRAERIKEANRKHRERKKQGKTREIGSIDICKICGKKYTVESGLQMHCPDCKEEYNKKYNQLLGLKYYYNNKETINPIRNEKRSKFNKEISTINNKDFDIKMNLRKLRIEQGLSIPELAKLSGVPTRTIAEIEIRNNCMLSTAVKLADALNVTLDQLCR